MFLSLLNEMNFLAFRDSFMKLQFKSIFYVDIVNVNMSLFENDRRVKSQSLTTSSITYVVLTFCTLSLWKT